MDLPAPESDVTSIAIRGNFAPVRISPRQLHQQRLIGDAEYAESEVQVRIPDEVSVFQAGWLTCEANPDELDIHTQDEADQERLRDLAVEIMRTIEPLEVSQLTLRRAVHFGVSNDEEYDAIGGRLVANEIWNGLLGTTEMRSAVYSGRRSDNYKGRIYIQIEPSSRVAPGFYYEYLDYYDLTRAEAQPTSRDQGRHVLASPADIESSAAKVDVAVEVLNTGWQSFLSRNNAVLERLWSLRKSIA